MRSTLLLLCILWGQYGHASETFSKSKKALDKEVYAEHRITFYARCEFNAKRQVDWASCGYSPRKRPKRAARVEWEHVMPAWEFGHQLRCWQDGGRKNCRYNPMFNRIEADMHNLRPAVGELNADRSNYRYGMVAGEKRAYGKDVDFEVNFRQHVAEPAPNVRGDIARTYFYMEKEYGVHIGRKQRRLFEMWNKNDPVSDWERRRNCKISKLQGRVNTYISICK